MLAAQAIEFEFFLFLQFRPRMAYRTARWPILHQQRREKSLSKEIGKTCKKLAKYTPKDLLQKRLLHTRIHNEVLAEFVKRAKSMGANGIIGLYIKFDRRTNYYSIKGSAIKIKQPLTKETQK